MKYQKKSLDYQLNMEAFHEMDEHIPMIKSERDALRSWVKQGHDIDSNPWNLTDNLDGPLNYLHAYRIKNGYPSGPWDDWERPGDRRCWDLSRKSFYTKEELDF
ncbi:MAG: hypothetical protein Q4E53_14660 [Eubacteriales bacterium]|nr:hypothetical protein [Eubacteriales bacterium]